MQKANGSDSYGFSEASMPEYGNGPARPNTCLLARTGRNPEPGSVPMHQAWSSRVGRLIAVGLVATLLGGAGPSEAVQLGLADFRLGRFGEAFEHWLQADAAGDARGTLYIGVMYDVGLGAARDPVQARAWYRRAADAGSVSGAFNLAVMNDAGVGGPRNLSEAAAWYARAAKSGYGRAEYNLAGLYEIGSGVPRSRSRAIALYVKAAAHGVTAARTHLAELGQQSPAPPRTGTSEPAETVAMQTFTQAQQELLSRGVGAASQAFVLFHRAAEERNSPAEYDLGYCYEHGIGTARDVDQARRWYERASIDSTDPRLRAVAQTAFSGLGHAANDASRPN